MIKKARGRHLHYPRGGSYDGASGSRAVVSAEEHAARYYWRNVGRSSAFAKSDMALDWVRIDPDLAAMWALARPVPTTKTAARRRRCLDGGGAVCLASEAVAEAQPLHWCSDSEAIHGPPAEGMEHVREGNMP